MLKKIIIVGGAAALLSGAIGLPLWSYARCGASWISETASESVPLEWKIKQARQMISDLTPEIERNARRIAREKIEVTRLEKQLGDAETRLAKGQSDIERLKADLEANSSKYTYGGRTYTSSQVRDDLSNRFKRFKTRNETVGKLREMLTARQSSLQSAHERMEAMMSAKRQLEVEVENLQARLGALRVAQTSSNLSLDDSKLSQAISLLDDISTTIEVEEETLHVDSQYFGEIDLDSTGDEDLLDEIAVYLNDGEEHHSFVAIQLD